MADLRKAVRLQVHGLTDHDKRVGENHTNEQIDPNRSHLNYNLVSGDAWENYVTRLNEVYCLNRKDVNTLAMIAITLPKEVQPCLLYTSPSPRDRTRSRMPSSA